jgi:signal transduction histidine kinase
VVVTGVDDASRAQEALRLGADEYVVKPYSISQLRLAWGQAFERRRQFGEQKRAERTRDELTELIFHDLRNPLTAARGYLSLMEAAPHAVGPRDVAAAAQGCDLAVDIIEHGEDLGRIERAEIEVKKGSLRLDEIVPAEVESLRPLAEGAGRRIRVACADGLPAVAADASLVKRVTSALVAGAIKYASDRADILVELSASRDRSEALLAVTDDGLPVTREFREAIFDKHSQGELMRAGSRRGRGLALPFAREACRRMGARIWVEDAEAPDQPCLLTDRQATNGGAGCRFVVAFRAASTSDAKSARGTAPASPKGELQHE